MFYVYYNDGYYENGDVGMKEFSSLDDVCSFINDRMSSDYKRTLDNYQIIKGEEIYLKEVSIKKVVVAD